MSDETPAQVRHEDGCRAAQLVGTCTLNENFIRQFSVGRKNWLFCGVSDRVETCMVISMMVEMEITHNLKTNDYLKFRLKARASEEMFDEELKTLTPCNNRTQEACQCEKVK